MEAAHAAREAICAFAIPGELVTLEPLARGHIHDTLVSTWRQGSESVRYLHQRMNVHVFQDIPALMHNVRLVTDHLVAKIDPDRGLTTLKLVPTASGDSYLKHASGPWRTYHFIDNTESYDLCSGPDKAFEAAEAFGSFQAELEDLDVRELRTTIPHFFSAIHRLAQFDAALAEDRLGRAKLAGPEIAFIQERRHLASVIDDEMAAGQFPSRVVHGDTKLNNVLFDKTSGQARCIVDLDTCMPGWSLFDFGDLVRFTAATAHEDELDLSRVGVDLELYNALVQGYLESTAAFLTRREIELMPYAARIVTLTLGTRFLADYLNGDVYFKISREGHNLDRTRVQLRLVECMERLSDQMAVSVQRT